MGREKSRDESSQALVLICFEVKIKADILPQFLCLLGVERYCSALRCTSGQSIAIVRFAVLTAPW